MGSIPSSPTKIRMTKVTDLQIITAATTHDTMSGAARSINVSLSAFRLRANKLGVYKTNQSRKGIKRSSAERINVSYKIEDILDGKYPQYNTNRLRKRLIKEGYKNNSCEICDKNGKLCLHHKDGDNSNHRLENLQILCYDCHAETENFCGLNKKVKIKKFKDDEQYIELILKGYNNHQILKILNLASRGANYKKVDRLRNIIEYLKINIHLLKS